MHIYIYTCICDNVQWRPGSPPLVPSMVPETPCGCSESAARPGTSTKTIASYGSSRAVARPSNGVEPKRANIPQGGGGWGRCMTRIHYENNRMEWLLKRHLRDRWTMGERPAEVSSSQNMLRARDQGVRPYHRGGGAHGRSRNHRVRNSKRSCKAVIQARS